MANLCGAPTSAATYSITLDRNIEFQQNIPVLPFRVIVVREVSNRMVHLRPLASAILLAVSAAKPGQLQKVGV